MSQEELVIAKAERNRSISEGRRMRSPLYWKQYCRELEIFDVINVVKQVTGYTLGELRSHARNRGRVEARQLFVLLCQEHTPVSFVQMGVTMNRDYTTAIYLSERKRSSAFQETWAQAQKEIDALKEKEFGSSIHDL